MNARKIVSKMRQSGFVFDVTGDKLKIAPAEKLTPEQCAFIKAHKAAILAEVTANDSARETRRQKVIAMLTEDPGIRYAHLVEDPDTDPVIVTMGIRGVATFELEIPKGKFDPFAFLQFVEGGRLQ